MSDVFSLIEEEVDAKKSDSVDEGKGSRLSSLVRESLHLDDKSLRLRSTSKIASS